MCSEVHTMYGAYYPYLYGRAGPSRSFYHQYDRFNQDLYSSSSGVPSFGASTSSSTNSHSPCSPALLPPSLSSSSTSSNTALSAHSVLSAHSALSAAQSSAHTAQSSQSQASHSSTSHTAHSLQQGPSSTITSGSLNLIASSTLLGQRLITKEEDLSLTRPENESSALTGTHNESSCSSGPESPHQRHQSQQQQQQQQQLDSSRGRAQYLSATCVVVTHYDGDSANVVDEHFAKALNFSEKTNKETSPMSSRNFPASFWDSNYVPPTPPAITHPQMSDLYSTDSSLYSTEPWIHNAAHYGTYAAAQAHVYHQNMANMAQYGSQLGLLRLPQQYGGHSSRLHHEQTAHALESAYSNYSMPGLEAQVQDTSKDLYWF